MLFKKTSFLSVIGLLAACGGGHSPDVPSNRLASFTVGRFTPQAGKPNWESLELTMVRQDKPSTMERKIALNSYQNGRYEEITSKVEAGEYRIRLAYYDSNHTLRYESCKLNPDEIKRAHFISAGEVYRTTISICDADSGQVSGNVPSLDVSSVEITPELNDGSNPNASGNAQQSPQTLNGNPFVGSQLYVNPVYARSVESSMQKEPALANQMGKLRNVSTAVWIDRIASISKIEPVLSDIRRMQKANGRSYLATFVIYNLPERDCAAKASAGELSALDNGLSRYRTEYIDVIANLFAKYSDIKIAAIVEPDSLPNLATNMGLSKCVTAAPLYKQGVAYAIQKLALKHVALYLDAAHGGWLGWPENRKKVAQVFKEVLDLAGGSQKIRGFASNVSNYSPLRVNQASQQSPDYYQFNPAIDELTFVQLMVQDFQEAGIEHRNFVIDTSRNGNPKSRKNWGSWCNVDQAAIGERPTLAPAPGIDAYLWIKPPGESDGTSRSSATRFDSSCVSADSKMGAPEAGEWFHEHFTSMVRNASPAL